MRVLLRIFTILCFGGVVFFVFAFIATRSYISFAILCLILGITSEIIRDKVFPEVDDEGNGRTRAYKTVDREDSL